MKNYKKLTASAVLAAALLGGCASDGNYTSTSAQDNWQLSGKIGLVYPDNNCRNDNCRSKSDQGKINWRQEKQNYVIKVSDPFDRVIMTIDGNAQILQAQAADQAPIQTSPNEFVALLANNSDNEALSTLSPEWLSYWVTGRPAPDIAVSEQSGEAFVQQGYRITAKQWRDTSVGKMPSLIVVSKGEFTLRLVVREWSPI